MLLGTQWTEHMNKRAHSRIEWPSLAVIGVFSVLWLGVVLGHNALPWWFELPALALLGAWHMSIQHEVLHGHPTHSDSVNTVLGFVPLSLYLPFLRYKECHIVHHRAELTHPNLDPESFYLDPLRWSRAGTLQRAYYGMLRTLAGRMMIGPFHNLGMSVFAELQMCRRDRRIATIWSIHCAGALLLGWWLFEVIGFSPITYLLGFCIGGYSMTLMRSFAEHRAVADGTRSAVVLASAPMSLLYLNNNLHHTHHQLPALAWYDLPAAHRDIGADAAAELGAGLYRGGYWEIARRYMFHQFCQVDHPLMGPPEVSATASVGAPS